MFTLDMLNAAKGDALVITYGDAPCRHIVIDGGPRNIYGQVIKPFLGQLGTPVPIELMVVTHVDDDHIRGILDLAAEQVRRVDDHQAPLYTVKQLWFNAFDAVTSQVRLEQLALAPVAGSVAAQLAGIQEAYLPVVKNILLESINQGCTLQDDARKLGWSLNPQFAQNLVLSGAIRTLEGGLKVTVVTPHAAELENLRKQWSQYYLTKRSATLSETVKPAALLDDSPYNLSSIAFLLEYQGKTMLMTGDARGDKVLAGLNEAGLLQQGKLHVDILKLPHHGSDANVDPAFFAAITARHYVISANGENGNPDCPTLEMLSAARPDDDFAIYLSNTVPHVEEFIKCERAKGRNYGYVTRKAESDLSLQIAL